MFCILKKFDGFLFVGDAFKFLGPLAPIIVILVACLGLLLINRIALGINYIDLISGVEGYLFYLPVGMRTDLIILCMSFSIPILVLFLLPNNIVEKIKWLIIMYVVAICALFFVIEIISWPFLDEFRSRPNQLLFQYFTHPQEVFTMVWEQYAFAIIIALIASLIFIKLIWKSTTFLFNSSSHWPYYKKIIVLPLVVGLMLLGARSGIGEATPNPSISAFSNDYFTNQLALNGSYSLGYSIYAATKSGIRSEELFGSMDADELFVRVKNSMDVAADNYINPQLPTLHKQAPFFEREKPLNLVFIVLEGFGADRVGILGGDDLTPNFDQLSNEGALFTEVYSIGTRTSRGIEAIVAGYPPTTQSSTILRLDLSQQNFATIASVLKQQNYNASFIYGGEANFDNMATFFLGNGFDDIIDVDDFEDPEFKGTWGVSDEDTFKKANNYFRNQGESPFVSVVLTMSNHPPFDFPENKIELAEHPQESPRNSHKYSDYALGKFFEAAKKEDYYNNTLFVVTADHPMSVKGTGLLPVSKFKIPALFIGPGIEPQVISTIASQLDLPTTAFSVLGVETIHPFIGRNLLNKKDLPGRSIMIYGSTLGYREENSVTVFQANKAPLSFIMNANGELIAAKNSDEQIKNALAAVLFPSVVYHQQLYRFGTLTN